jgi:chromosome segregation ATPase
LIEYLMLIIFGACAASLIWLAVWPALARRTERLARRRIEATLPMSVSEFASERDQLRATLAVKEARIEKQAETLSTRHAAMLAEVGRTNARLAVLEENHAVAVKRVDELTTERESLETALAEASAALDAERSAHGSARDEFGALDLAHRTLVAGHANVTDAAEQHRVEAAALLAEKEALLGRVDSLEAALKSLRADHAELNERAGTGEARSAALVRERDTHRNERDRLEDELHKRDARIAELDDHVRQRENEKIEAEGRASNIAAQLAASDAHGARLALDLAAARERTDQLAALHLAARGIAGEAASELDTLRHKVEAEHQRAEQAEAAERLHVANAVAELHKLAEELESERTRLRAATASLDEARGECDRLQGELARHGASAPATAQGDGAGKPQTISDEERFARRELVAMIERLAGDIAQASGAEPLPPIVPAKAANAAAQPAAAE